MAPLPAVQRLQKTRERSASDAPPLSPRFNLQRSASISELNTNVPTSTVPATSAAPSSFTATLSRVFSNGLTRKRSDRSLKGKEKDEKEQEEFASIDATAETERRKAVPAPLNQPKTERRNTPSQFPQTPRPFSITSSADHSGGHGAPNGGPSALSPTIRMPVPPEVNISPPSVQPTPTTATSIAVTVTGASGGPSSAVSQARTIAAARAAARSTATLPIGGTPPRRPRPSNAGDVPSAAPAAPPSSTVTPPKPSPRPIPKFDSVPVPWKGLTLDAAQWTFTSKELQDIVGRAIRQSAEASAIRLLNPEILDNQLPNETYRLELLREDIKARYKFQVRRRRLLMRSLALYIDGSDPETAKRLTEELAESMETTDHLSQELFQVTDQLAQMSQLTQRHTSSALSMALRKLNASFIKAKGEAIDFQLQLAMLEAERDEAWATAESIERELDHYKRKHGVATDYDFLASPSPYPPSSWGSRAPSASRVSAARKNSSRASKASLRMSKRSTRSSGSSIRFIGPGPATSASVSSGSGSRGSGMSRKVSQTHSQASHTHPPMPASVTTRSSSRAHSSRSHSRRASWAATPTTASKSMVQAQNQLFEMLGIPHEDITRPGSPTSGEPARPRSISAPSSPASVYSRHSRRTSLPNTIGLLESPQVIAAMLTLPSS